MSQPIYLDQDSPEWHAWRFKGIGSSEISSIMDHNNFKSSKDLFLEKVGLKKNNFKANHLTKQGKILEGVARDMYEFEFRCEMIPCLFEHDEHKYFHASSDGFSVDLQHGVEFKVSSNSALTKARVNQIPNYYYDQIQWLMLCSNTEKIHYVVLNPASTEIHVTEFLANELYQSQMTTRAINFWRAVEKTRLETRNSVPQMSIGEV
jgi:putative phage-type endonuclease